MITTGVDVGSGVWAATTVGDSPAAGVGSEPHDNASIVATRATTRTAALVLVSRVVVIIVGVIVSRMIMTGVIVVVT